MIPTLFGLPVQFCSNVSAGRVNLLSGEIVVGGTIRHAGVVDMFTDVAFVEHWTKDDPGPFDLEAELIARALNQNVVVSVVRVGTRDDRLLTHVRDPWPTTRDGSLR